MEPSIKRGRKPRRPDAGLIIKRSIDMYADEWALYEARGGLPALLVWLTGSDQPSTIPQVFTEPVNTDPPIKEPVKRRTSIKGSVNKHKSAGNSEPLIPLAPIVEPLIAPTHPTQSTARASTDPTSKYADVFARQAPAKTEVVYMGKDNSRPSRGSRGPKMGQEGKAAAPVDDDGFGD